MKAAREIYHQKDRSGSSAGVRAHITQQIEEIASADPTERALLWDKVISRTKQLAREGEIGTAEESVPLRVAARRSTWTEPIWVEYDRWNTAFAQVVYTPDNAFQPVYLDLDDDLLDAVARHLDPTTRSTQDAAAALFDVVRQTLVLDTNDGSRSVFSYHRERVDEWWREAVRSGVREDCPPPILALLAVFARAAELMEKDETFQANAYYPRLQALLRVRSSDAGRLQHSFRRHSEWFWKALNEWIAGLDGAIGLPTAEAVGHRFVGVPMSQALLRAADRQGFGQFFTEADLEPALPISVDDMTKHLDRWIQSGNASASIQKLWKASAGRATVAEAAILALSQWDGTLQRDSQGGRSVQPPVITARITRQVTGRRLRLGFAVRGNSGGRTGLPKRWTIKSAPGEPEVDLDPINDRLLAPDFVGDVDPATLLDGELEVCPAEKSGLLSVSSRRPQPLVVLSYIEEAGIYVEVDRVRMLEPHVILVNLQAKRFNGPHAINFDSLLTEIAEEGFSKDEALKGLPGGWLLYRDVTIVRSHTYPDTLLEPLKPVQSSTLIVGGGLRLPGHAVRWHSEVPLTLKGSAVGAMGLHLSITSADSEEALKSWSAGELEAADEITASTAALDLEPGVYRAELKYRLGAKEHLSISTFAFCDSDEPRVRAIREPVAYDLGSPLGAVSATVSLDAPKPIQEGKSFPNVPQVDRLEPPWWSLEPIEYSVKRLTAPSAPDSCAVTGSHHWDIETHLQGMKKDRAECMRCGRVRLYSPTGTKKRSAAPFTHVQAPLKHLDFGEASLAVSGDTLLDALTWLGGGTAPEIARVVRQVYDSALSVDEIVRVFETTGHISVARNPESFAVERWEMSPKSLAELDDGAWLAIGCWTRSDIAALGDVAGDYKGTFELSTVDWLPRRVVRGLDEAGAQGVAEDLAADLQPKAGRTLLASLPPLSVMVPALTQVSDEGIFDAEWFDANQARWLGVESIGQPGAFRTRQGFVSAYFVRTPEDVANKRLRRGDSRVVKHIASSSRPLIGYDFATRRLFVPLGAELPGLYGRALSLLSGRAPARVHGQALIAYADVDKEAATLLASLLKG